MEFYTKEETRQLDEIKRQLACRLVYRRPRPNPWTQEEILHIMRHNVCTLPVEAARMASDGHHKVAAAMLRMVVRDLELIQGMNAGTVRYESPEFYNVETGEKIA
jgi:hypothetical protein